MRLLVLPLAAFALIGASDASAPSAPLLASTASGTAPIPSPAAGGEAPAVAMREDLARSLNVQSEACRDRIMQAREDTGLPLLEREPASPENPHLIYAVDRRQDGCSVMVMMGNPSDIRPLPVRPDDPIGLIPADNGR
ncbi:hypothetical protein ACI5KX_09140 [Erythrobacter sp. GH1-10]|uniref:hypothetical protein n=1 Tax=Erythrobacter sp. GH1-10 TaxID=3349334 RepID=UPI003877908F